MPHNKTQHFVPRCYLHPFTRDEQNRGINLFNRRTQRAIADAKVRKQCAGDYFYGDDLVLERLLQPLEAAYGARAMAIRAAGYNLTEDDARLLQRFWLLQFLRTDAGARTQVQMLSQLQSDVGMFHREPPLTVKVAVQDAMRIYFRRPDAVTDLSVRLVRNRTDRPFITSDNPAVMTNRWHLVDRRTHLIGPGLESAGAMGLLPLSPSILCLIYDHDVYTVPYTGGWVGATDVADVDAFNEHQVLSCQFNLYFQDWAHRDYVRGLSGAFEGRRVARYKLAYAAFDHEARGSDVFREVGAEQARNYQRSIVHSKVQLPAPSKWPSIIRWRSCGAVYESQTGSGFARRGTRAPGVIYRKVRR